MKKNKLIAGVILSSVLALSASMISFAQGMGAWKNDANGWWWQYDDGTYPTDGWQWLDGNNDGIAECYYFSPSGYLLSGTITPDNCTVDENGAWTVNGVVQQQAVQVQEAVQEVNSLEEWKNNFRASWKEACFAESRATAERLAGQIASPAMLHYTFTVPHPGKLGLTRDDLLALCEEIHNDITPNNYHPYGFYGYYWEWNEQGDGLTLNVVDVIPGYYPTREELRSMGFTADY